MASSADIGALSIWLKVLLLAAGAVLMLTGADLLPVDPSRFHTPHWVVLVAGLAFSRYCGGSKIWVRICNRRRAYIHQGSRRRSHRPFHVWHSRSGSWDARARNVATLAARSKVA